MPAKKLHAVKWSSLTSKVARVSLMIQFVAQHKRSMATVESKSCALPNRKAAYQAVHHHSRVKLWLDAVADSFIGYLVKLWLVSKLAGALQHPVCQKNAKPTSVSPGRT
eukprot:1158702-Pelagomonas_calceolata.AAC.6